MKQCNSRPIIKYIRIFLSLTVIGLGFFYRNWLGVIGIFTLISAFNGTCPLSINLKSNRNSSDPIRPLGER